MVFDSGPCRVFVDHNLENYASDAFPRGYRHDPLSAARDPGPSGDRGSTASGIPPAPRRRRRTPPDYQATMSSGSARGSKRIASAVGSAPKVPSQAGPGTGSHLRARTPSADSRLHRPCGPGAEPARSDLPPRHGSPSKTVVTALRDPPPMTMVAWQVPISRLSPAMAPATMQMGSSRYFIAEFMNGSWVVQDRRLRADWGA